MHIFSVRFVFILSFFLILLPNLGFGYFSSIAVVFFSSFLFFLRFGLQINLFFVLFLVCLLPSLMYRMMEIESIFDLRDYARFFIFFPLMSSLYFFKKSSFSLDFILVKNYLLCVFIFFIFFDFIILFINSGYFFGVNLYPYIVMPGMQDYTHYFWRHIGVLGNPNLSGCLYALMLFFLIISYRECKNIIVFFSIIMVSSLLFYTYSRTAIISFFAGILFYLGWKKSFYFFITFSLVLCVLSLFNFEVFDLMFTRFKSSSSLIERINLWDRILSELTWSSFSFGTNSPVKITDNDYIFFYIRFGFFLATFFFSVYFFMYLKLRNEVKLFSCFYKYSFIFSSISSLAGGVYAFPGLSYFVLLVGCLALLESNINVFPFFYSRELKLSSLKK